MIMKDCTPQQPALKNPLIPRFSVRKAIVEEVEREDLVRWSRKDGALTARPKDLTGGPPKNFIYRIIDAFTI